MLRARFEPVLNPVEFPLDDADLDRIPPVPIQIPRATVSRSHKSTRFVPASAIGTRTLGRASNKQPDLHKTNKEYGITLSARPGYANAHDAFLIVLEVVDDSSSWNQGLRSRDLFTNFGGLTKEKFVASGCNLETLLPIVSKSIDSPLECTIIRGQRLFNITLRGMRWDHGVCLGAVINTYPEPVAASQTYRGIPDLPPNVGAVPCKHVVNSDTHVRDVASAFESFLHFDTTLPAMNTTYRCEFDPV